jgi:hypothetical protein
MATKEPSNSVVMPAMAALDATALTQDVFVEVMACLTVAHAKALPLKDRHEFLTTYANRLDRLARSTRAKKHIRDLARALSHKLMELGHVVLMTVGSAAAVADDCLDMAAVVGWH